MCRLIPSGEMREQPSTHFSSSCMVERRQAGHVSWGNGKRLLSFVKNRIMLLCAALFYAGTAVAKLGVNCGEHPDVFQNKNGLVWFTPEELEKRATKRVEPVMPPTPAGFHYDGY